MITRGKITTPNVQVVQDPFFRFPGVSSNMMHIDILLEEAVAMEARGNHISAWQAMERALYAERRRPSWLLSDFDDIVLETLKNRPFFKDLIKGMTVGPHDTLFVELKDV